MKLATFLLGCFAAASAFAGNSAFYVNYDAMVPTAPLQLHELSIVHPDAELNLAAAHAAGNQVLAYLSVGEIAGDAPYLKQARDRDLRVRGRNEIWNSEILDLSDSGWADLIVDELAAEAADRGFDGFFLDTLDSIAEADRAAGIELLRRLRAANPKAKIIANRGFGMLPDLKDVVDGVLVESVFGTFDFEKEVYRSVPPADTEYLVQRLEEVEKSGFDVLVLDYADPKDSETAFAIAEKINSRGWSAFVSTPELRGAALAPWREVPRRVFSLFGNLATEVIDQVRWPVDSFTAARLQTPLEWLGYEVDYGKVEPGVPLPRLGFETAAIILPRGLEVPLSEESRFVNWLIEQKRQGKKLLIWGGIPISDDAERLRLMRALGMSGTGNSILPVTDLRLLASNDSVLAGAEVKVRLLGTDFTDLQAPAGSKLMRSIGGVNRAGKEVRVDALFSADWGGMAIDPYVVFQRPDFRELWKFDIFAFLRLALGRVDAPLPDATTRQGRRMFLSHIDGDGFINKSETALGKFSSEVVRDEILKKYPVPITVSIIEAEVKVDMVGMDPYLRPKFEAVARDIFELPNVEVASHSYSHPFMWIPDDKTAYLYDRLNLELRVPYNAVDLRREIAGSVNYINTELAPPGKEVEVFLWTGNCRPPPEALRIVRELGIVAMNGGDTLISRKVPTVNAVAPRTIPWGDEVQVLAPAQNENVYTNDWEGPLFGTFVNVIETFERTESPRRFKPVNIYYHFYSADFFSSLRALVMIHEWAMEQNLHSIKVSDYVKLAADSRDTTMFASGEASWTMVNQGLSNTYRFSANVENRIDMANSEGVTGWIEHQGDLYIHTDGRPVSKLTLVDEGVIPTIEPRLVSSTAELVFTQRKTGDVRFTVKDLRPATVVLAGLPSQSALSVAINGSTEEMISTEAGRLEMLLPPVAEVSLTWK